MVKREEGRGRRKKRIPKWLGIGQGGKMEAGQWPLATHAFYGDNKRL
jgi:hypothetical protein